MHTGEMLTADARINDLAMGYLLAATETDKLYKEKMLHQQQICEIIGERQGINGDGFTCTWRRTADSVHTDWEAVAKELGCFNKPAYDEAVARATTTKPGVRRFLMRRDGGK
jgi:hypothetical protein